MGYRLPCVFRLTILFYWVIVIYLSRAMLNVVVVIVRHCIYPNTENVNVK